MREEYIKQCIAYLLVHIASLLICYIVSGNSVFLKLQHFQLSRHHYYLCSNNVVISFSSPLNWPETNILWVKWCDQLSFLSDSFKLSITNQPSWVSLWHYLDSFYTSMMTVTTTSLTMTSVTKSGMLMANTTITSRVMWFFSCSLGTLECDIKSAYQLLDVCMPFFVQQ